MALLTSKYDHDEVDQLSIFAYIQSFLVLSMAGRSLHYILQVDTSKCFKQLMTATLSDNPITDFSFPLVSLSFFFLLSLSLSLPLSLCFVLVAGSLWKADCCTHLWDQLLLSSWYNFSLCLIYSQKSSVLHFQTQCLMLLASLHPNIEFYNK